MAEQNSQLQVSNNWESPDVLNRRINRMIQIQHDVMKPGVDYGTIPGCDKPSLYKPGAELLCVTFGISDDMANGYPERIEEDGHIRYIVKLDFTDRTTGLFLGHGIGECSTAEDKYGWRKSVCDEEFDATPDSHKRVKYGKARGGGHYTTKQIRTNPADLANTVLKMAKKRAKVDGVLNVLAASRVFAQDLEELPEGLDLGNAGAPKSSKPSVDMPKAAGPKQNGNGSEGKPSAEERKSKGYISEAQEKRLFAICKTAKLDIEDLKVMLLNKFGIAHLWALPWKKYKDICKTCGEEPGKIAEYAEKVRAAKAGQADGQDAGESQPVSESDNLLAEIRQLSFQAGVTDDASMVNVLAANHEAWGVDGIADLEQAPADVLTVIRDYFAERTETGAE